MDEGEERWGEESWERKAERGERTERERITESAWAEGRGKRRESQAQPGYEKAGSSKPDGAKLSSAA